MSQLDRLLALFPAEMPKPSEEAIAAIRIIDAAVEGTRAELEVLLAQLEGDCRPRWRLGGESSWSGFRDTPFASFPQNDGREFLDLSFLQGVHEERLGIVRGLFEGDRDVLIEEGGVKSFQRANVKAKRQRDLGKAVHCPDVTRMRLVVPDLISLDRTFWVLVDELGLQHIATFNHYSLKDRKSTRLNSSHRL